MRISIILCLIGLCPSQLRAFELDQVNENFDNAYEFQDFGKGSIFLRPISNVCVINSTDTVAGKRAGDLVDHTLLFYSIVGNSKINVKHGEAIEDCGTDLSNVIRIADTNWIKHNLKGDLVALNWEDDSIDRTLESINSSPTFDFVTINFNHVERIVQSRYALLSAENNYDQKLQKFIVLHELNHFLTLRGDHYAGEPKEKHTELASINGYYMTPDFSGRPEQIEEDNKYWWEVTPKSYCDFDAILMTTVAKASTGRINFQDLKEYLNINFDQIMEEANNTKNLPQFKELFNDC